MTTSPPTDLETSIATMEPAILNRMNVDFEDSILLVGRILVGRPAATAARLDHIGVAGVRGTVVDADGEHPMDLPYDQPISDPMDLTDRLMGLVLRARAESGEEGETAGEREVASVSSLRTFVTSVVAVEEVHPHLRRITFGGGDLVTFEPAGPDTFLYVLLPPPGRDELTIDQSFSWEAYTDMPEAERPVGAYYTLRRWDRARHELEMLFVLHEPAGPASRWAAAAQPGDRAALWGPRTAFHPPEGTERYLLVADETGLPAVAAILDELDDAVPVHVLAEVADSGAHQDLPTRSTVAVAWLHRDGLEAGTATVLADAAAALEPRGPGTYVWGGGESRAMTGVRKIVRQGWGLPRDSVSLVAYWRHAAHVEDAVDDEA
jgi:NADPH-dependent ferric siderophore reductase